MSDRGMTSSERLRASLAKTDYVLSTVDAYFSALSRLARVRAWTKFSLAPTMEGAGGKADYLDEFGFPASITFAHLKNMVENSIDRDAKRLRAMLVDNFLVDETRLAEAERAFLGEAAE